MSSVVPRAPLDLSRPHRLHVVGVGGPGMSAIAIALAEMGHRVSGSDLRDGLALDRVRAAGVDVHLGHDPALVRGCDAVTASTAIPADNVELAAARSEGVATVRRAGMLASICAQARSIAVAGTHGKTTTSSMLMLMLVDAGWAPSFVIGGDVFDAGTGAQWTGSEWLVVEADESDGTHLELPLHATILTNVEIDPVHDDVDLDVTIDSFDRYLGQIPGPKVVCADDPHAAALGARHGAVTYGLAEGADFRAVDLVPSDGAWTFTIEHGGEAQATLQLPQRGVHNVVNALGAVAMASTLGVGIDPIVTALERFGGVARRFDIRGVDGGATFVDDYAHLPSEIAAVIAAARDSGDGWRRVVAVFQPNRYPRIAAMWHDYAHAFVGADVVVITEIYPSGTTPIPGVTGRLVAEAVEDAHPDARVVWLPRRDDLVSFLAGEIEAGDVCVSMGCGDVASLPDEVMARRARRRTP